MTQSRHIKAPRGFSFCAFCGCLLLSELVISGRSRGISCKRCYIEGRKYRYKRVGSVRDTVGNISKAYHKHRYDNGIRQQGVPIDEAFL